jgi:transmembrane sensor
MIRMRRPTTGPASPEQRGPEAAADWVARMGSDQVTRDDERALQEWLAQDAAHANEFKAHAAIFNDIGDLANDAEARRVLMGPRAKPVVSSGLSWRLTLGGVLAAAAAVVAAIVLWPQFFDGSQTLITKLGEQRHFQLQDGSEVMLNTDSRLRVQFEKTERRMFLDRGQAWFRVAKAPERPFRVFVGNDEIRALGTAFDVRRDGNMVIVTLEDGRVAIFRDTSQKMLPGPVSNDQPHSPLAAGNVAPGVILQPGEAAQLVPTQAPKVISVDLTQVEAWRVNRLVLDSTPLGDAVREFNRYGGPQIVLDPSLAQLRINGVFDRTRPVAFAESVAAAFPVKATVTDDGAIVLAHR